MFNEKYKLKIKELEENIKVKDEAVKNYQIEIDSLKSKVKKLSDVEFKYKVTKSLLDDDEAILELIECQLTKEAKHDLSIGVALTNPNSSFYRLVNTQANKIILKYKNGTL